MKKVSKDSENRELLPSEKEILKKITRPPCFSNPDYAVNCQINKMKDCPHRTECVLGSLEVLTHFLGRKEHSRSKIRPRALLRKSK